MASSMQINLAIGAAGALAAGIAGFFDGAAGPNPTPGNPYIDPTVPEYNHRSNISAVATLATLGIEVGALAYNRSAFAGSTSAIRGAAGSLGAMLGAGMLGEILGERYFNAHHAR